MSMFASVLSIILLVSLSCLANTPQLPPIYIAIQENDLQLFYKSGEAVYKYLDEMIIGKEQAGSIDHIFQNYNINLRLGAIDGAFVEEDHNLLTYQKLNESLGHLYKLNDQYRELALNNYEADHSLNLIKIGFLHALLVMKKNTLNDLEAYDQILQAFHSGFIYPLGHSTGVSDSARSVLVLDLLRAYSLKFPIDHLQQLVNNVVANIHKTDDLEKKKFLWELVQNLALYGAQYGTAPIEFFALSESDYRFQLAILARSVAENNKFKYSRMLESLSTYRHIAYSKGFISEARKAYLHELWLSGPLKKPVVTTLLFFAICGVWISIIGCIASIGYRLWKANGRHGIGYRGNGFKQMLAFVSKALQFSIQKLVETFREIVYCFYKDEVRKKYTIELAVILFCLSWILNDWLGELQILVAN